MEHADLCEVCTISTELSKNPLKGEPRWTGVQDSVYQGLMQYLNSKAFNIEKFKKKSFYKENL